MIAGLLFRVLVVLFSLFWGASARAEEGASAKAEAQELVDRAAKAYRARRWIEAGELYLRAHQIVEARGLAAKPELIYNAALAFDDAGECARAAELYERFAALKPEVVKGSQVLAKRIEKANACRDARAAAVVVEPPPPPEPPPPKIVETPPPVRVELPPPVVAEEGRWSWPWVSGGIGAAALACGVAFRLLSMSAVSDYEAELGRQLAKPPAERNSALVRDGEADAVRWETASNVSVGVGVAAIVGTIVLFAIEPEGIEW